MPKDPGVLHGLVVKFLTLNPGVLGSSHNGACEVFCWSVLGQDTSEPQPGTGKPRKGMNNVSFCHDMTEIPLKAA